MPDLKTLYAAVLIDVYFFPWKMDFAGVSVLRQVKQASVSNLTQVFN
ncbi:hypothetical protein PRUB_b0351 [Pseudoalteromonas rubra]|uniref:Uncharacterized protein n=1 Tax=Pseudoalteromonas rubra TaxID=43658 RepID=A0A8T0BZC3_9GAMM|nr:hypothetical protein PRUB_b0351 [Pseudoalteromonas rubra]